MASRVVVVGGGLAGLATAHHLLTSRPDLDLLLVDGGDRVGGKVRSHEVAGVTVDVGAESVLARSQPARDLLAELDLGDRIVHPEPAGATIFSRGVRHSVPARSYLGIPSGESDVSGLLDEGEAARAARPAPFALEGEDASVADVVGAVHGRAVVDRIVEPLLGGVYAGRVDELSLRATMPALWAELAAGRTLPEAVAALLPPPSPGPPAPRVLGLRGGIAAVAERLAAGITAAGGVVSPATLSRDVRRTPDGWQVVTGPTIRPEAHEADAVVLATPASPTSRLLGEHAPAAAAALDEVDYASMAVVTVALPRASLPGSGFLVPAVDGRTIKASTFSSTKWAWVDDAADDVVLLRASIGRAGEVAALQCSDEELVTTALTEVAAAIGRRLPQPVDAHVQRWGGGLPQYTVGHSARVATVRKDVAALPGLEVTGAAYDGVGIASVLAGSRTAADRVLAQLDRAPRAAQTTPEKEIR